MSVFNIMIPKVLFVYQSKRVENHQFCMYKAKEDVTLYQKERMTVGVYMNDIKMSLYGP